MNEVTKYKNELNTVAMRKWSKDEMDFFFAILSKAKDQGTRLLEFSREDLSRLISLDEHLPRQRQTLDKLGDHVSSLKYIEKTPHRTSYLMLFQRFDVIWNEDYSNYKISIRVSEDFDYILNRIEDNFTKFPLDEFVQLKSTYAKTLYRQLKQYRTTGWREFSLDEFRQLLDVPKSYPTHNIDKRVLAPCLKELPQFFPNLKLKKIHADKRGRPLVGLRFSWTPEEIEGEYDPTKYDKKQASISSKKTKGLPEWYSNTDQKPVDPEILQKALDAQKRSGKNSNELEGEQLPFDF